MNRFEMEVMEGRQLCSVSFGTEAPPLALSLNSTPVYQSPLASTITNLSDSLKTVIQQNNVPGMVAIEMRGGKEIAEGTAGVRKRGTTDTIKIGDRMHVGSLLKGMTATMIGRLVDKGMVSLDWTLGQMLGAKLSPKVNAAYLKVTLAQLLGQRSGLPSDAGLTPAFFTAMASAAGTPMQARSTVLVAALRIAPTGTPGSTFLYSNIGYVVAAGLVERIVGKSYEQLMEDEVFTPLGMTSAIVGPPLKTQTTGASGHAATGTPTDPIAEDSYNYLGAFTPAGDMSMTVADVAKYANVHAGATTGYLSSATLTRIHTALAGPGEKYGLGLFNISAPYVGTLLAHDGTNQYWYARMLINPATKSVMIIATNQGGPNGTAAVSAAMNKLMGGFLNLPFSLPVNISMPSVG